MNIFNLNINYKMEILLNSSSTLINMDISFVNLGYFKNLIFNDCIAYIKYNYINFVT